ncbi:MAG: hypothetical protein JO270_00750 [Acidobacteriaceae bacterium]|nr:hypothetical protein [Acidobacteriaceae bacterium]
MRPTQLVDPCEGARTIPRFLLTGEAISRQRFGGLMVIRERFSYKAIHDVLSGVLEQDVHAKRDCVAWMPEETQ